MKKEALISDLSCRIPHTHLDQIFRHVTSRLLDHQAEDFTGDMNYSGPQMNTPDG